MGAAGLKKGNKAPLLPKSFIEIWMTAWFAPSAAQLRPCTTLCNHGNNPCSEATFPLRLGLRSQWAADERGE